MKRNGLFAATALGSGATVFGLFVAVERALDPVNTEAFHLLRGISTGLAVGLVSFVFYARETQEHRKAAEKWFAMLNGLPVAVFALNREGTPAFANRAAVALLGRGVVPGASVDELSSVYPSFVAGTSEPYPPERMPIVRALHGEEGARVDDVELEVSGQRVPIDVWAGSLRGSDGEVELALAAFLDVSDRRKAEQQRIELAQKHAELAAAYEMDRRRQALINAAAHELNTPLTPLLLELPLMEKALPERAVKRVRSAVERIQTVANRLVDAIGEDALKDANADSEE